MRTELHKLAADLPDILRSSARQLHKLANNNAELLATSMQQEHELKAYKLARRMEQRGLQSELNFDEKVAKLLETPLEKFASYEQAVELAATGFRLGSVQADEPTTPSEYGGQTPDPLDAFISSQVAYT